MLHERTERVVDAAPIAIAADGATAVAGAANAAWALGRLAVEATAGRRTALIALALVNGGAALQALFAQALFTAVRAGADVGPFVAPLPWLASRAMLLCGVLLISLLILRRRP